MRSSSRSTSEEARAARCSSAATHFRLLAALQRIGRETPPALLIRAEDALQSVRSAMVLGAVLPEVRQQAEILSADLGELVRLRKEIAQERDKLARDLFVLAEERQRLSVLIDERQKRQSEAEQALGGEREHAHQLARAAGSLNALIGEIEQALDAAARAKRAVARASETEGARRRPISPRCDRALNPRRCLQAKRSPAASVSGKNQGVRP
jgi:septal ring factor EnvC (AmiA/AmiB activator)